jgi:hypothetical protein
MEGNEILKSRYFITARKTRRLKSSQIQSGHLALPVSAEKRTGSYSHTILKCKIIAIRTPNINRKITDINITIYFFVGHR